MSLINGDELAIASITAPLVLVFAHEDSPCERERLSRTPEDADHALAGFKGASVSRIRLYVRIPRSGSQRKRKSQAGMLNPQVRALALLVLHRSIGTRRKQPKISAANLLPKSSERESSRVS